MLNFAPLFGALDGALHHRQTVDVVERRSLGVRPAVQRIQKLADNPFASPFFRPEIFVRYFQRFDGMKKAFVAAFDFGLQAAQIVPRRRAALACDAPRRTQAGRQTGRAPRSVEREDHASRHAEDRRRARVMGEPTARGIPLVTKHPLRIGAAQKARHIEGVGCSCRAAERASSRRGSRRNAAPHTYRP